MLRLIKDKKNTKDEDKIWLYVPETPHNDPNSKWRKIDTDFLVQPDILKKQRAINAKIITFFMQNDKQFHNNKNYSLKHYDQCF